MSKHDADYFRRYYQMNRQRLLEEKRWRYSADPLYRRKVRESARLHRRLATIVERIQGLFNQWEEMLWVEKQKRNKGLILPNKK